MPSRRPRFDFVELHILHHADEEPLYGLWMIEELTEHGYSINASQLYPRFHRLEKLGYLARTGRVVDGHVRKYYRTTPAGSAYFAEQRRRLLELVSEALTSEELAEALARRRAREERKRAAKSDVSPPGEPS
jgi:PadR family transcriptional regulator, regulatory protein PadR